MPERDLARMLATLSVHARPGRYAFTWCAEPDPRLAAQAEACVREDGGIAYVLREEHVPPDVEVDAFRAAWLTLDVHSALEAVGLTAAVSTALADAGIACNVIAGARHDHLLVDAARCEDALDALAALQRRHAT